MQNSEFGKEYAGGKGTEKRNRNAKKAKFEFETEIGGGRAIDGFGASETQRTEERNGKTEI